MDSAAGRVTRSRPTSRSLLSATSYSSSRKVMPCRPRRVRRAARASSPKDETDLPEGLPRLRENGDVAFAVGHPVGRVVLGAEFDPRKRREGLQQALTHLVDELLDGLAVEVVEGELELATHDLRRDMTGALADRVMHVGVVPVRVHHDREGAVGELRERRVLV